MARAASVLCSSVISGAGREVWAAAEFASVDASIAAAISGGGAWQTATAVGKLILPKRSRISSEAASQSSIETKRSGGVSMNWHWLTLSSTAVDGRLVDAPYVSEAVAVLECRVTLVTTLPDIDGAPTDSHAVFGQVMGIHIDENVIRGGRFDLALADPILRAGYLDYAGISPLIELARPRVSSKG